MLKELETDGVVDRRRKGVSKTGQLPPVIVADVTGRDRDGELIAVPRGVGRRRARPGAEDRRHDAAQATAGPAGPGRRRPRAPAPRATDRGRQAPLCRPGHQDHRQAEEPSPRHLSRQPGRGRTARAGRQEGARRRGPRSRRAPRAGRGTATLSPRRPRSPAATACPRGRCASGSARSPPRRR